jgi:hypothetical protein
MSIDYAARHFGDTVASESVLIAGARRSWANQPRFKVAHNHAERPADRSALQVVMRTEMPGLAGYNAATSNTYHFVANKAEVLTISVLS